MPRTKQTTETAKKIPPPANLSALLKKFEGMPDVNLTALNQQLMKPGDPGSLPILLKGEDPNACVDSSHQWAAKESDIKCRQCRKPLRQWHVRYCNTAIEGQWARIKARGYVPVRISELSDADDISDLVRGKEDDYVRRGDTGKEVLMKRPFSIHFAIKHKEHAIRAAANSSKAQLKSDLAEAAGKDLGDEAGQAIHNGGIQFESIRRSQTTIGDEMAGADSDSIDE